MKCPGCGKDKGDGVRVYDTRSIPNGIWRRRKCVCGVRFTTIETIVPDRDEKKLLSIAAEMLPRLSL